MKSNAVRAAIACLLCTVAMPSAFAADAAAQEMGSQTSEPRQSETAEIIVTARFRQESLQDTPLAITAITGDSLAQSGLSGTDEIGRAVPNAYLRPNGQQFGRSLTAYIRGVGQADFDYAFEPGVALNVDGVYYSTLLGSVFDLLDLERVEVLRGPQGTLSGRGAIGGAINLISRKPQGDGSGSVEISAGNYNALNVKASIDLPIVQDTLFMRVSGLVNSRQGYQKQVDFTCAMQRAGTPALAGNLPSAVPAGAKNCVIGHFGGEDVKAARVALRAMPVDGLEINIAGDYTKDDSSIQAAQILGMGDVDFSTMPPSLIRHTQIGSSVGIPLPYQGWNAAIGVPVYGIPYDARFLSSDPYVSYATFTGSGDANYNRPSLENWGVGGTVDVDLSDNVTAKLILGHRAYDTAYAADSDLSPLPQLLTYGQLRHREDSAELRLSGLALDKMLEWTLGGYYFHSRSTEQTLVELNQYGLVLNRDNLVYSTNKSVFAHAVANISDSFRLSGGLRYSDDSKDFSFSNGLLSQRVVNADSRIDWKVAADFKPTDDIMIYGSVATGYRPGSFNPRPYIASQFRAVDGEELVGYELGMKTSFLDNRAHLNVAGFYSDYKKRIIALGTFDIVNGVPDTSFVNGPAKIKGFEAELTAEPADGFRVNGTLGYTHFSARDILIKGQPGVPAWNAALGAEYEASLGSTGWLTPRMDWFYTGSTTFLVTSNNVPPPPEDTQKSYSLVNARLTWANPDKDWSVTFAISNLFDKRYANTIQDWRTFGFTMTGEYQPGAPRMWTISARKTF